MKGGLSLKKIFVAFLVTAFLLVGCSRDSSQQTNESSNSHSISEKSSTSISQESSSIDQTSESSASEYSTNHSTVSESTSSTAQQTVDTVSSSEFGGYATFYFTGMNVPDSININTNTSQVTFNVDTPSEAVYNLTMQNNPVKSIRVFSANKNDIRTVKVSTTLTVGQQQSGAINSNNQSGDLYLFHNKQGGLSLATPNYAGNVTEEQSDVMIEVLQ